LLAPQLNGFGGARCNAKTAPNAFFFDYLVGIFARLYGPDLASVIGTYPTSNAYVWIDLSIVMRIDDIRETHVDGAQNTAAAATAIANEPMITLHIAGQMYKSGFLGLV
jgi:hypothetical protein